jgi:hypothetical protein
LGAASVDRQFTLKPKEYPTAMLPFLHDAERDGWHHLVTGDESWFFLDTSPCRTWTLSREDVITKTKHQIQSKKIHVSGPMESDRVPCFAQTFK